MSTTVEGVAAGLCVVIDGWTFPSSLLARGPSAAWAALANGHGKGQGAEHETFSIVGDVFDCGQDTYTITAGDIRATFHEGESASGNANFTGTLTPQKVVAQSSDGPIVSMRGAVWFGATMNAQQDTMQETFTAKLQFVEKGKDTVENVNIIFHITVVRGEEITLKELDLSSCEF